MDAIDNPSYFSLSSESQKKFCHFLSLRRWSDQGRNSATLPNDVSGRRVSATWQNRRNFRSLKRTNSEDTHLLVLGKPRPTDLPPLVYTSQHQRHSSAGSVNSNDLLHQDMVHCVADNKDDGDVFLSINRNGEYYNTGILAKNRIPPSGRRRHSIGSFLNRDRSFNSTVGNEQKITEAPVRRKFKRINFDKVGSKMVEDELDILLVSCGESEVATMWVDYLITCFQSISNERRKPPFKLLNIKIEDILCLFVDTNASVKCPSARLQIVIICPSFLEKIHIAALQDNCFSKILHPDKVLAMMLGVQDDNDNNHMKTVFSNYEQWRKMHVKDQDTTSVGDFLGVSMDILSRTWQMQEIINAKQEHTYFSILPKKVKVGQDKVLVLLTEPLTADDVVIVSIDKSGQRTEVTTVKRNPYTLQFTVPGHCLHVSMLVNVLVEKNGQSLGKRMIKCESRMRELEQLLRLLDNPISFLCQSFGLNTCDREQVDSFLLGTFLKNVPPNFNLLTPSIPVNKGYSCNEEFPTLLHFAAKYGLEKLACQLLETPGGEQACHIRNSYHLTPTEIAERASHARLANTLKGHMQMNELAGMYNYLKGMTSENLRSTTCKLSIYISNPINVLSSSQIGFTENNYLLPRPVSDTYLIPPAARPVDPLAVPVSSPTNVELPSFLPSYENFKPGSISTWSATSPMTPSSSSSFAPPIGLENYEVPRSCRSCAPHTPPTPHSPLERKFEGYLDMHSAGNESCTFGSSSSFGASSDFPETFGCHDKNELYKDIFGLPESQSSSKYGSANLLCSKEKLTVDDELLEIINDFKNNVFTIKEVEKLVEEWQNRSDVQQSFKEKQEQLNKMREEYDRIQRKMKEEMKRPTPFERFRKFFSRGKSKHGDCSERTSLSSDISTSRMRATSSISLHSSSSNSSGINSISSGIGPSADIGSNRVCLSTPVELSEKGRNHVYMEVPQPPRYIDFGASPSDFSEYVQPDCTTCKVNNRLSNCNGSLLNDTIHECAESEPSDKMSDSSRGEKNSLKFYSFGKNSRKSVEKYKTNSLRLQSKSKAKHVKNKVKSTENLIYGRESKPPSEDLRSHRITDEKNRELSACEILCAETIKCMYDFNKAEGTEGDQIRFEFDKPREGSPVPSKCCGSPASSLDLSSLSLNSNCTIDENGEIKDEQCLELKISEGGDTETETVPPVLVDSQTYLGLCNLPEYVNVKINPTESSLPRRYKYATVSS